MSDSNSYESDKRNGVKLNRLNPISVYWTHDKKGNVVLSDEYILHLFRTELQNYKKTFEKKLGCATNYYDKWNFDELNNQQLLGLFENSKSYLRKKRTLKSEVSLGIHKECLKRTFLELNRRDEMSFVDYQKVLKNLRTYENRYKGFA